MAEKAIRESSYSGFLFQTSTIEELIEEVLHFLRDGDLVLIKGSRGMALERLTEALEAHRFISPSGGTHAP